MATMIHRGPASTHLMPSTPQLIDTERACEKCIEIAQSGPQTAMPRVGRLVHNRRDAESGFVADQPSTKIGVPLSGGTCCR